jgi:hypothetical protein
MRSLLAKHITHIYLADLVVAEKLLALASWRDHLTAKKAQPQNLAASANPVKI